MCQVEPRTHCKTSLGKSWVSLKKQNESQAPFGGQEKAKTGYNKKVERMKGHGFYRKHS